MKKQIALSLIFMLLLSTGIRAESENGGHAGAFLKLAVQARPAAMGGAYIAVSDDAAGQLHNPAGTIAVRSKIFSSAYRVTKLDRKLGMVSVIFPTRRESALGLSWLYAGYGSVERRNTSGQLTGGSVSSNEHDFAVTFAKQFTPFLGLGTKLNYYYKRLADISANSIGINLGAMIYIDSLFEYGSMEGKPITDIKAGLIFNHLSAVYSWNSKSSTLAATQDDELPFVLGIGGSCRTFGRRLLLAVDLDKNFKESATLRAGAEYDMQNRLFLRAGLNDGVFTAGMGYGFLLGKNSLNFHYAFSAERTDEGSDHIISMEFLF